MKSEIMSEAEVKELQERFKNRSHRRDSFPVTVLRRVLESHEVLRRLYSERPAS